MIKIGDKIYYANNNECVCGYVKEVFKDSYQIKSGYSVFCVNKNQCFASKEEAESYKDKKNEEEIQKYYDSINNTTEALQFLYNHTGYAEGYTDCNAREAVKRWAKDNLGIEL